VLYSNERSINFAFRKGELKEADIGISEFSEDHDRACRR